MYTKHHKSLANINKIKPQSDIMLISCYFRMLLKVMNNAESCIEHIQINQARLDLKRFFCLFVFYSPHSPNCDEIVGPD